MSMSKIEDAKTQAKNLIRLGKTLAEIKRMLLTTTNLAQEITESVLNRIVEDVVADYPDFNLIQKIMRSKLIADKDDEDKLYIILDPLTIERDSIHRARLVKILSPKVELSQKIYTCKFEYKPFDNNVLLRSKDGTWIYNSYIPPKWMEAHFYSQGRDQIVSSELPLNIKNFLMHLVSNDKLSYEYILDWLANGIQARNHCILTTIGNQGIGKGVLGEMMRHLFGKENYFAGRDEMFKSRFNSQILNKRLVYADEIQITNPTEEDRIKLVVNEHVEIEKKGVDSREYKNYANFYISSNNLNSIRLSGDDRRFSIVNLTETKLIDIMSKEDIESLVEPSTLEQFAQFLYHRKVDSAKMLKVFKSDRTEQVRASTLKEWEEWLLDEFAYEHLGDTISLPEIKELVEAEFGSRVRPGRQAISVLVQRFPDRLSLKCDRKSNKRVWSLHFINNSEAIKPSDLESNTDLN